MYRSAVASVKMGCITPRVGVGFERIGNEAEADRRRGVVSLGFAFASERGFSDCAEDEGLPEERHRQLYQPGRMKNQVF